MTNLNPNNQPLYWLPLSRLLVNSIAHLFELHASRNNSVVNNDYSKLLNAAAKLKKFSNTVKQDKTLNQNQICHDLRNIITTVMGYTQLIQEELQSPRPISDLLKDILQQCNQLLAFGCETIPSIVEQLPISSAAGTTITGTILVVDDQAESREILRRYLQGDQCRFLEAEDGLKMFTILKEHDVDLILLDLILPEMDGDELLQELKQDPDLHAIPVIVVSGIKDRERVIHCIETGAEDYLFKPFNPVLLQARISAGVERKRWHDKEQQYRKELECNQRFIRSVFGRYLSEEIVASLLEEPDGLELGGVQRKVTVLMADIRGFTTIAEQLPPQRVVRLLNNYLGAMSEIIMKYHGTIDEFIGDAILAIFGAPMSREDDADRAISCALEMQTGISDINVRNCAENLPEIRMGISINTGLVVAGNIGSEKRAKYGVVGHAVNQTARIEEHCAADKILISEATLMDSNLLLCIGSNQTIQVKGLLKGIKVFELTSIKPNSDFAIKCIN